jgi:transcriptional regulator GlxA family with amidase domain
MNDLGIFIFDEVEVLDFSIPFEVFSVANQLSGYKLLKIKTIAEGKKSITTKNGLKIRADFNLEDISNLDFLVLPGGDGTKKVIENPKAMKILTSFIVQATWSMSVCSGSRILGKAGFLDQKQFCTHHEVFEDMNALVSEGLPRPDLRFVQSDKKIWTAAGISSGIDLALHLTSLTFGNDLAQQVAKYMEYHPYLDAK